MVDLVLLSASVLFVYWLWVYLISLLKGRNDIADVAWGLGFVVLACFLAATSGEEMSVKSALALLMVSLWGVRLALHIELRHKGRPEDGRYVAMRGKWKYKRLQAFTNVFMTQGFFMLLVGLPIILFFYDPSGQIKWYNWLGVGVWIVGFIFEAVGDYQLAKFIKNKPKKSSVMQSGLWAYTRHPNYFGEITLWWGFWLFALPTSYWYLTIIGPVTITFLILGVSGIPMLEKRYLGNKEYDAYKKRVNAFFPGAKYKIIR